VSVVCYGNAVLDIIVRVVPESLPFGASLHVESIEQRLGGNGASTAYALGKLGVPVRLLAPIGRDAFGDYIRARLETAGVDVRSLEYTDAPTATTVALVNAAGERALLHRLGASAEGFSHGAELPGGFRHIHVGTPFAVPRLRPRIPELLEQARRRGLTTSLDTQWDNAGRWMEDLAPSLRFTDLLFANREEARMLTGLSEPSEAAQRLLEAGARTVVLKLGAQGCLIVAPDQRLHVPAFQVPVVDTTGAGDCFVGGFLAALQRGLPLAGAARIACAAGALSVQQAGAVEGLLSWEGTEAWLRSR
jgi:sugar/nucleoside kinase (ribokinase family)